MINIIIMATPLLDIYSYYQSNALTDLPIGRMGLGLLNEKLKIEDAPYASVGNPIETNPFYAMNTACIVTDYYFKFTIYGMDALVVEEIAESLWDLYDGVKWADYVMNTTLVESTGKTAEVQERMVYIRELKLKARLNRKIDPTPCPEIPDPPVINSWNQPVSGSITFHYTGSDGADYYNLYAGHTSGNLGLLTTNITTNPFTVSGFVPLTTYYFRMTAVNVAGESDTSNLVSIGVT
jgi:hypothetical protein